MGTDTGSSPTGDPVITVVSGLPRSGTSLAMQMLEAGGMPVLRDQTRQADEDNPRGYHEYERVKSLGQDSSWMSLAAGKAVKVVSMLLYHLPTGHEYKVVFAERKLDEVLASQAAMLARRGAGDPGPGDAEMKLHFEQHLSKVKQWLSEQGNIDVLYCRHSDLLAHPTESAAQIAAFIARDLDIERMAAAVDPVLHRQKG